MRQNTSFFHGVLAREPRLLFARQAPVVSSVQQVVLNRTSRIAVELSEIVASVDERQRHDAGAGDQPRADAPGAGGPAADAPRPGAPTPATAGRRSSATG